MDFDAVSVCQRMREDLRNATNKLEGSFCMDNLQAVAEEIAMLYTMEIQQIADRCFLDTAQGTYLDRRALDFDEVRKEGEGDDAFRNRLLEKIRQPITSGNVNHYIYWAKQVPGVGNAKCIGCWNGPGTVKVIVLSDRADVPDNPLIERVQAHIEENRPIGANVTVSKATPLDIIVNASVTLLPGFSTADIQAHISTILHSYCAELAISGYGILSYHKVGDLIFSINGIADLLDFTLNGKRETLRTAAEEFFLMKEVILHAD